jgi:type I restriction enzyme M protein
MAMGTSQMLGCLTERFLKIDPVAEITSYGQELNNQTFAIAKADTLIKGGNADNMRQGDTLGDDKFAGYKFDYIISNPPFGIEWKTSKKAVENEHLLGEAGRFAPGLPAIGDGQMLFLLNGVAKLKEDEGRMAIIQNGSSLFKGDAGSGESEIRGYLLENDWLEAIVQLPNDLFYNTGIATYIWIVTKNKSEERQGKVQLIDASQCSDKRRKSLGNKRVEISDRCRELIMEAYKDFTNWSYQNDDETLKVESKVFDNECFKYSKLTVERPLINENSGQPILKKGKPQPDPKKRDTEIVPWTEDIEEYFTKNVLPYSPDAWIDEKKTKFGYEIPFTREFYKYVAPRQSEEIFERLKILEAQETELMTQILG